MSANFTSLDWRAMRGRRGKRKAIEGLVSFSREATGMYISSITWTLRCFRKFFADLDKSEEYQTPLTLASDWYAWAVTNEGNCLPHKFIACHYLKMHYNPLSSLPFPIQPDKSRKRCSEVPCKGCKEDMIVKRINTTACTEGSSTLGRWKPFLLFPEFLPACSVGRALWYTRERFPWLPWQSIRRRRPSAPTRLWMLILFQKHFKYT